ncbi:serine hydrolase domain-containing protein [Streptomyces zingiberis]|uniref:Beta-lactamase family protein n=1 Tax=Streptomyces zingiberis TaxID=2053010 RepID=A0ABX1BRS5_9ACTN|nr:serine hydrolase domain-containing protein [Streptomyces zingiberis]NJQ00422.1 beta-lactamase family protein [Streptomyces zingiberis]
MLNAVERLVAAEIGRGLESGVQLSVSCGGRSAELAAGENGLGHPMTPGTAVPWTCSAKTLGALAFAAAWEAGAVGLDTPVARILPEYAGGGRERVRVRHLLTHTTGVPDPVWAAAAAAGTGPVTPGEADALVWALILDAPVRALPGAAMSYSPVTNWFVLDRLLAELYGGGPGESHRRLCRRLGLAADLGLPELPPPSRAEPIAAPGQETGLARMRLAASLPLPGLGVWGTTRELRRVGEVLLTGTTAAGEVLLSRAALEALTTTHWPGTRHRQVSDTDFPYGLGVMTQPLLFGRRCSARVFGHAGGNTSTLLIDPMFDLVAAVYWNGRLDDVTTFARRYALVRALYEDLGLDRLPVPPPTTGTPVPVPAQVSTAGAGR